MKLKKLLLGLFFSAAAMLCLTGCGGNDEISKLTERAHTAEVKQARLEGAAEVKDQLIAKTNEAAAAKVEKAEGVKNAAVNRAVYAERKAARAQRSANAANYQLAVMKAKNGKPGKAKKSRRIS
jgi:hypothetical protein